MDGKTYLVGIGEVIGVRWMKEHPDVQIIVGSTWDTEKEKQFCGNIVNPFYKGVE